MWSLQIVSAAATLSSGGTAAAAGLLLPSSLLILCVLVGPIEVLFLVQIIWVAVKELNLSYYIGGNHIYYHIYPLW